MSRDVFHPYDGSPILGVAGVIEIQVPCIVLRDILEIGVPRRHRAKYSRLIVRIQAKGLGKAAVLSRVYLSARHQCNNVVLHRRRIVLFVKRVRGVVAGTESAIMRPTRLRSPTGMTLQPA